VSSDLSACVQEEFWPSSGRSPILGTNVDWLISFPSSGSSLNVLCRLGLHSPLFGIASTVEVNDRSSVCGLSFVFLNIALYASGDLISRGTFERVQVGGALLCFPHPPH